MDTTLARLGEHAIIKKIRERYNYSWGDEDCSLIDQGDEYLLVTTDSISKGSHMPDGASMASIGYFFAAVNLSDIAAMGGTPRYFLSALSLPRSMKLQNLLEIQSGMKRCMDRYNVKLIGGDLKEGGELSMTGTVLGSVPKGRVLRRGGARYGDLLCVTGTLGKNGGAYHMWKRYRGKRWTELMLKIEPRIREGILISKSGASSATDLSDGVYSAVSKFNELTGHGFEIDYSKLPFDRVARLASDTLHIGLEEIALNTGGDYELLFTISKAKFRGLQRRGVKITAIGRVAGKGCVLIKNGKRMGIKGRGYEHFRRE